MIKAKCFSNLNHQLDAVGREVTDSSITKAFYINKQILINELYFIATT